MPTAAERFFFDNNGYLVLDGFLAPGHVEKLLSALEKAIDRRRSEGYRREHPTAFPERLDGPNYRIFHLLDEDPLVLARMDYGPIMEYVRAHLHPMPHVHATDASRE